jgi:phenylalanine-4-hydroxylase
MPDWSSIESNELIDRLPDHLKQFIKPQLYESYSAIDQAVWRYVMHKNVAYLSKVAHGSYVDGLKKTGISIESIPSMYGMNRILKEIGWAAVAVDGFIPPNAFMEFQAYNVLVIAADIRQLEHIDYTPSPDIIHESAGHAPMIANPDYAEYLRRLGAIGAKAIWNHHDGALYEAIRKLSILKEAPGATPESIQLAQEDVESLQRKKVPLSEMAQIRNLQWWTVEYGLIGSITNPKIYGAGLLSSIGESEWCLRPEVKKIPLSLEAVYREFDITKPQPHLYVTPDFPFLMNVLEEFAATTALRTGGLSGINKLIASAMTGTIELDSGLQISSVFASAESTTEEQPLWIESHRPTALAYREKEIIGHGHAAYPSGIFIPIGKIDTLKLDQKTGSASDIFQKHLFYGQHLILKFENGCTVEGLYRMSYRHTDGRLLFLELDACSIQGTGKKEHLHPAKRTIPLAGKVVSAFAGAADVRSFPGLYTLPQTTTPHPEKTKEQIGLETLYAMVRKWRNSGRIEEKRIQEVFKKIRQEYPNDWLLCCELHEITRVTSAKTELKTYLLSLAEQRKELSKLIRDGIDLAG